jgi:hypothetical protein
VIERALVHVMGPGGAGKTTFVERLVGGIDAWMHAARCIRDDSRRQARETAPRAHRELRRYRDAGASGAALFVFPERDVGSDAFFMTHLMADYSQATMIEGDSPLRFVDLTVFVAPPLPSNASLLVRRQRDRAKEERAKADAMEELLRKPDGVAELLGQMVGGPMVELARGHPRLLEDARAYLLAGIAEARKAPAPEPTEHWAVADGLEGIEQAQLVVVNIRDAAERERGERLVAEVGRIRKDAAVFADLLGFRGSKVPISALVANLADPADSGTRKAVSRVRRVLRKHS